MRRGKNGSRMNKGVQKSRQAKCVHSLEGEIMLHSVQKAVVPALLPLVSQSFYKELFVEGKILVLISTSTLAQKWAIGATETK